MTIELATLTALGLRQGDQLSWELQDGAVRVKPVTPLDLTYLRGLEAGLQEWTSAADDEAFADL
jgi:antitoxin component of MazEF toxin-antitoxin module